jgi:hypothetical protein
MESNTGGYTAQPDPGDEGTERIPWSTVPIGGNFSTPVIPSLHKISPQTAEIEQHLESPASMSQVRRVGIASRGSAAVAHTRTPNHLVPWAVGASTHEGFDVLTFSSWLKSQCGSRAVEKDSRLVLRTGFVSHQSRSAQL